jgi:hypothetical protein
MPATRLLLITGERIEVEGQIEDVGKRLQDAARSSAGTLAWLREVRTDEAVGVNPAHVVTLTPADE